MKAGRFPEADLVGARDHAANRFRSKSHSCRFLKASVFFEADPASGSIGVRGRFPTRISLYQGYA